MFGKLLVWNTEALVCLTLEHAYADDDGNLFAKIPSGTYECKRGLHQLAHMKAPFTTFQLQDVPGHTNILIHVGNYNDDSEGCILLGKDPGMSQKDRMVASSKETFANFMKLQTPVDEFTLTVKDIGEK